jgi:DNA-binding response OmpR family regulator
MFRTAQKGASAAVRGGAIPRKTRDPKRVLIVEDDIDAARTLFLLVEDMGHTGNYAINGYSALEIAKVFRPEIILLDLGLPGPNGFEVCEAVKANQELKNARVIVLTGYTSDEFRVRSQKAGCELHLVKPVSSAVLEHLLG